jgi:L-alanine-DL-glutamate epimerase-like enolase superfamily enzyme
VELLKQSRQQPGAEGDIMLDCWMAPTEPYTLARAEAVEPYRVYWMEEENNITRGPDGISMRPPDCPGFGWELIVD